jgi:hypothetical protein
MLLPSAAGATEDAPPAEEDERGVIEILRDRRLAWVAATDAWFFAGPSAAFVNIQDTRMSPLRYPGAGAGFAFTDEIVREKWLWPTGVAARYAVPQGPDVLPGLYQSISWDAWTALLYRFADTGLATGGGVRGGMHFRVYDKLSNSAFNSDSIVSLTANGAWEEQFAAGDRELILGVRLALPLFSWVGRTPAYAFEGLASYWVPPWKFLRATVETSLTWPLRWSGENRAKLSYTWDAYGMNEQDGLHTLRVGIHSLELALGTRRM